MRRALVLAMFCASGCFSLDGISPPSGYEVDELACADGRDNDLDGRTDCQDEECLMHQHCGEQIPLVPNPGPENTFESCSDGIDNDDDGQFDCGDRQCQSIFELCCLSEVDDTSCSDLRDNDGNGFADCADFSCRNNLYVTVCEREASCADTIDNDGDRSTDCNDDDCVCNPECNPGCAGEESTLARCQDGVDNDDNGFVDCADFGCSMSDDPLVAALCMGSAESSLEACSNERDDDGDGYADCADFSCSSVSSGASPEAAERCAENAETSLERCMDGIDNDGNGFSDCRDFSCARSDSIEVVTYCRTVGEANLINCTDNIDNDDNGFVDCADFSCRFALVGWGINLCANDNDCPVGAVCANGFCLQNCGAGDTCGPGTQCDAASSLCLQTCVEHAECDPGESCYRGRCLALRSPCFESVWIDADSDLQGNELGLLPEDASLAEQVAMATAACTDGRDGDGDGFTDCEDWECNYNPRVLFPDSTPICRSAGGHTCVVGGFAGRACATDADCGGISGACALTGLADQTLVCP
jgi:hypothetical protein